MNKTHWQRFKNKISLWYEKHSAKNQRLIAQDYREQVERIQYQELVTEQMFHMGVTVGEAVQNGKKINFEVLHNETVFIISIKSEY